MVFVERLRDNLVVVAGSVDMVDPCYLSCNNEVQFVVGDQGVIAGEWNCGSKVRDGAAP